MTRLYTEMSYRQFDALVNQNLATESGFSFLELTGIPNRASKCYTCLSADEGLTNCDPVRGLILLLCQKGILQYDQNYLIHADVMA